MFFAKLGKNLTSYESIASKIFSAYFAVSLLFNL